MAYCLQIESFNKIEHNSLLFCVVTQPPAVTTCKLHNRTVCLYK